MEEWMKVMVRSKSVSPLYFIILILEVLNVLDMSHLTIFVMVCISQCNVNDMIFFLPSPSRTLDFRFCWLWTSQWKNRVRRGHKKLHCVPFQTNNNNNNKQFEINFKWTTTSELLISPSSNQLLLGSKQTLLSFHPCLSLSLYFSIPLYWNI